MELDLERFKDAFFEEANENHQIMEESLLEFERSGGDREILNKIFRAAHSIKGGSGTFGLEVLQRFTHALESLLDPLREGTIEATPETVQLLLQATDALGRILDSARAGREETAGLDEIVAALEAMTNGATEPSDAAPVEDSGTESQAGVSRIVVSFAPNRELFQSGLDPILLLRDLARLGQVESLELNSDAIPPLDQLDPESCYLSWRMVLFTEASEEEVRDLFVFVEDESRVEIATEPSPAAPPSQPAPADVPDASGSPLQQTAGPQKERARSRSASASKGSTLRVSSDKLDKLVNLVGELVIAQSVIMQALNDAGPDSHDRMREAIADMERHTRELQERVLSVRMVPVSSIFNRFQRMVRDLGQSHSKKIHLSLEGGNTEIDKGIIEQLADPLTHLIRNSVDHGLEPPDEREAAGKSPTGTLRLAALHESGSVVIEVADDGRGIDLERVRAKAISQGILQATDALTDDQTRELIFAPGFSTAEAVTDISGRGVGMDVVRRNIDALSGSLTIGSNEGQGTCIRLKLPLTLAIVDGLTLRIGSKAFVLPLLSIIESFRPSSEQLKRVLGSGEVVRVRGEPIPLVRLYELLSIEPEQTDPCQALVVIVEAGASKLGFLVDEILGQAQVVVKSLETNYHKVEGIMGATILGDGRVGLILDAEAIARRAASERSIGRHGLGSLSTRFAGGPGTNAENWSGAQYGLG